MLAGATAILVSRSAVAVRGAAAMLPVVLPVVVIPFVDVVLVEVVGVINGHIAAAVPVAIAPVVSPSGAEHESGAKGESHPGHVARIVIRRIRVCRWPIDDYRIV